MRMARLPLIALIAASMTLYGCFAVEKVDPGSPDAASACESLLLDDFTDGDLVPSDHRFGSWQCDVSNSSGPGVSCGIAQDSDGGRSLSADFSLHDPLDQVQELPAVVVNTIVLDPPLDLSPYRWLLVTTRVESKTPPLPQSAAVSFSASFGCATVTREKPPAAGDDAEIDQSISVTSDWQPQRLELSNFGQPYWQSNTIKGGAPSCLRAVDHLIFAVGLALLDGESAAGNLFLDDIALRGDCLQGTP